MNVILSLFETRKVTTSEPIDIDEQGDMSIIHK